MCTHTEETCVIYGVCEVCSDEVCGCCMDKFGNAYVCEECSVNVCTGCALNPVLYEVYDEEDLMMRCTSHDNH